MQSARLQGLVFGFIQSLLVGLYVGNWDGGTGLLWGLIVAIPSGVAAIWLGFYASLVALAIATAVFVLSYLQIMRKG